MIAGCVVEGAGPRIWSASLLVLFWMGSSIEFGKRVDAVPFSIDALATFFATPQFQQTEPWLNSEPGVMDKDDFRLGKSPPSRNRQKKQAPNRGQVDISTMDTSDILNCFQTWSYICFQKKIIMYLVTLNRANRINLLGKYLSFLKVRSGNLPPITEQILRSRHMVTQHNNYLSTLLKQIFDDFMDTHILRITVPVLNAKVEAKSGQAHCYEISLSTSKVVQESKGVSENKEENYEPLTCYRSDPNMVALSTALIMKMMVFLPTLLKIIAAKAIFGLIIGVISITLSKMALLPMLLSYARYPGSTKGYPAATATAIPAPAAAHIPAIYRQNADLFAQLLPTTENYGGYYPAQQEQPGKAAAAITLTTSTPATGKVNSYVLPEFGLATGLGQYAVAESKVGAPKYMIGSIYRNSRSRRTDETFNRATRRTKNKRNKEINSRSSTINGTTSSDSDIAVAIESPGTSLILIASTTESSINLVLTTAQSPTDREEVY